MLCNSSRLCCIKLSWGEWNHVLNCRQVKCKNGDWNSESVPSEMTKKLAQIACNHFRVCNMVTCLYSSSSSYAMARVEIHQKDSFVGALQKTAIAPQSQMPSKRTRGLSIVSCFFNCLEIGRHLVDYSEDKLFSNARNDDTLMVRSGGISNRNNHNNLKNKPV